MVQKEALDVLKLGFNVYLTGAAGAGKTYVLNQYIAYLRGQGVGVGITASTGIAATHMGGVTIHSWSGMGIRDSLSERDMGELLKRPYLWRRLLRTKVLIIDEVSMLHAYQLDLVDVICRRVKGSSLPFGGMQVVLCGDFFQLPPVVKGESRSANYELRFKGGQGGLDFGGEGNPVRERSDSHFVYNSSVWGEMGLRVCYLDEQFRQDDRGFLRVLNDIRNGEVNEETVEQLSERIGKEVEGYAKATRLYTHNADVDTINEGQLAALEGEEHVFMMSSRGNFKLVEVLQKSCLAPERLVLKVGAAVMFVKNNFEEGYVNGTLGEVIGFAESGAPVVRTFGGDEITVGEMSWEVKEEPSQGVVAGISQLPLRLAWAITVHKSQGMSLDAAEVDLRRSFLPGMGYVALSRVRSLRGLQLLGMNSMALAVNEEVAEMDRELRKRSDEVVGELMGMGEEKIRKMQRDVLESWKGKKG